jgi:hypothetical protein
MMHFYDIARRELRETQYSKFSVTYEWIANFMAPMIEKLISPDGRLGGREEAAPSTLHRDRASVPYIQRFNDLWALCK